MAVRPILRWPDKRLATVCTPVHGDMRALTTDLLDTMYAAPGRGLAAPQIGVLMRVFVMDTFWKDGPRRPYICLDPVLRDPAAEWVPGSEGCLSIPGITVEVNRAVEITLDWRDLDGNRHSERLDGFAAICAQHEYDHLEGIVTLDRLSPAARRRAESGYA